MSAIDVISFLNLSRLTVAKPTTTSSQPQSRLKSADMATIRIATRQRATAIEVNVTALLTGPRSLSSKLQLMAVTFSAAAGC